MPAYLLALSGVYKALNLVLIFSSSIIAPPVLIGITCITL
jgi:hypothetical protein